MSTPIANIPEIMASQTSKYLTHNEAIRALEALALGAIISQSLTSPPSSPILGSLYIPAAGASGAWLGLDDKIVQFNGSGWTVYDPWEGARAWDLTTENLFFYTTAGGWEPLASGASIYDTNNNGVVDNSERLNGQFAAYYVSRANHTGQQAVSTLAQSGATLDQVIMWDGVSWSPNNITGFMLRTTYDSNGDGVVNDSDELSGQPGTYYLSRSNHTGTQSLSTLSNSGAVLNDVISWNGSNWVAAPAPATGGDMFKSVYDGNNDGTVDNADQLDNQSGAYYRNRTNHTGTQNVSTLAQSGAGTNDVLSYNGTQWLPVDITTLVPDIVVRDEGTVVDSDLTELNFVGAGVTATNVSGVVTVTVNANMATSIYDTNADGVINDTSISANIARRNEDNDFEGNIISNYRSSVVTISTTTYTISDTDTGFVLFFSSASAITVTIPTSLSTGFNCLIIQGSTGQLTFTGTYVQRGGLVQIAGQYGVATIVRAGGLNILGGDLSL